MSNKEFREAEHVLRLSTDDGREIQVWHPENCRQLPEADPEYNHYPRHACAISHHLFEWGLDLHLADVPDGIYLAEYWARPPYWSGPVMQDAEDGIDLMQLVATDYP